MGASSHIKEYVSPTNAKANSQNELLIKDAKETDTIQCIIYDGTISEDGQMKPKFVKTKKSFPQPSNTESQCSYPNEWFQENNLNENLYNNSDACLPYSVIFYWNVISSYFNLPSPPLNCINYSYYNDLNTEGDLVDMHCEQQYFPWQIDGRENLGYPTYFADNLKGLPPNEVEFTNYQSIQDERNFYSPETQGYNSRGLLWGNALGPEAFPPQQYFYSTLNMNDYLAQRSYPPGIASSTPSDLLGNSREWTESPIIDQNYWWRYHSHFFPTEYPTRFPSEYLSNNTVDMANGYISPYNQSMS